MRGGSVIVISICLAVGIYGSPPERNNPIVNAPSGTFEGSHLTSRLGKTIYSFRGIRYAEPPVGELRFKNPVPIEKYDGIYNATEDGFSCPQPTAFGPTSEDCLFVNVYSTQLPVKGNNPRKPVVIYLHPGGFYAGGSVSYWSGPQYLMDQDVVFVTFNYRLSSLGFLSTGDKHAPGNYALKDQVVLLKWVQKNIEAFGGDPNSVTLLGYSAGGWSIILHLLSPMSQGLFHKAISMSGAGPLGQWPLPTNQLEIAKRQARLVGCPDDSSENIVKCLRKVPFEKFNDAVNDFRDLGFIWSPVIEGNYSEDRFITEEPIHQVMEGRFQKIPIIIGQTRDEFGYFAFGVVDNQTYLDEINSNFEKWAPVAFVYEKDTEQSRKVSRGLKKAYFNDKPIDKSQFDNLSKLFSDGVVGFAVNRATKLLAQYSTKPVYSYCFTYKERYSHFYLPGTNDTVPWGTVHHDELIYLLYISRGFPFFTKNYPPSEARMVDKLTKIVYNFAKTGKPILETSKLFDNVQWDPYNLKNQNYVDIGEKMTVKEKLYQDRYTVWEELYPLSMYS